MHSTNTLERLNKEAKRRADVGGIFPSEVSIIRLIGAVLLKANDDWQMQHRYMGVEARGEMLSPASTNETLQLSPKACPSRGHLKPTTKFHHVDGRDLGSERMRQRGPAREHFQMKQCDRPPKLDFGHFRETRRRSG